VTFEQPPGATPIDPDTLAGLIPNLSTQGELNEFEERNILEAVHWARRARGANRDILKEPTLRKLHEKMFDKTWRWAGRYRLVGTNIGIDWYQIPVAVTNLCLDTRAQIEASIYPPVEAAARFHHALVAIHPFPNGNGRHARLATDILCERRGWKRPTWGARSLSVDGAERREYIAALKEADGYEIARLMRFMTS
jgi:Fic-DOC domain mobile mystery protein B